MIYERGAGSGEQGAGRMEVGGRRCDDPRAMVGSDLTRVGLCAECRWSRRVVSGKGSVFWMCERSKVDPRFRKYPALPVLACAGFEEGAGVGGEIDDLR
jgi:hypothetical protein